MKSKERYSGPENRKSPIMHFQLLCSAVAITQVNDAVYTATLGGMKKVLYLINVKLRLDGK